MTQTTTTKASAPRTLGRVRVLMFGTLMAVLATWAMASWAQPMGGHGGHHEMGGGMMMGGSPERMGRMIDHMLDGLNANDAQRGQIKQIAASAGADLKAQAETGRALRQRALQAFTAPTVDAATVEQVRAQMLQLHEQTSRRMTQAMLDIARVLTPEQRAKIGERMRDWQSRMDERRQREQREPPRR